MAALHSVSDLVSNEEDLQYQRQRIKTRLLLCAESEDGTCC